MAKARTVFYCQQCGYESAKWLGKCPSCQQWNSFAEEIVQKEEAGKNDWRTEPLKSKSVKARTLDEIESHPEYRISSINAELDRVLGGGIVPGSLVLIGGEPGIGKSTLMLQVGLMLKRKVIYVSGEESEQQIKMRAERLMLSSNQFFIVTETNIKTLFSVFEAEKPEVIVIDSIQTLYSSQMDSVAGSIGQVRQCAGELMRYSKETQTPIFLIGHITKDGLIAGPKVLEHMVDTVLQFEGDQHLTYRILRTTKNRFGSTSEIGIYEMLGTGLREVSNPSEILISVKDTDLSGVTIGATLEGNRPLLIETQALVSPASYGTPQRTTTGFDQKRLNMLIAVLEKRVGFRLGTQDVFLNMAGGIKVEDPAIDLSVCVAMVSSFEEIPVSYTTCFAAEIGLGGELRPVNKVEQRIAEAEKLGFSDIVISSVNRSKLDLSRFSIKVHPFGKLNEVFQHLFG